MVQQKKKKLIKKIISQVWEFFSLKQNASRAFRLARESGAEVSRGQPNMRSNTRQRSNTRPSHPGMWKRASNVNGDNPGKFTFRPSQPDLETAFI